MKSKLSLSRMGMRGSTALIIIGLLILFLGIFITINSDQMTDDCKETSAVIVNFNNEDDEDIEVVTTLVSFTANGKKYENILLRQYQASWQIGDTIDICYNVNDPSQIWTRTMEYSGFLYMILSVPFLLTGIYKVVQFARIKVRNRKSKDDNDYDEENDMDIENSEKFKISTVIIPFSTGIPFTVLGIILLILKFNEFISLLITVLGGLAIFAGLIALGNFGRKKLQTKKKA